MTTDPRVEAVAEALHDVVRFHVLWELHEVMPAVKLREQPLCLEEGKMEAVYLAAAEKLVAALAGPMLEASTPVHIPPVETRSITPADVRAVMAELRAEAEGNMNWAQSWNTGTRFAADLIESRLLGKEKK